MRSVEFGVTVEALDSQRCIISVLLSFSSDSQLGHLGGWFVSFDNLSCAADVESEGMLGQRIVKFIMATFASASSVEALKADIEPSRIILFNLVSKLSFKDFEGLALSKRESYDGVETLSTIFAIDGLRRVRGCQPYGIVSLQSPTKVDRELVATIMTGGRSNGGVDFEDSRTDQVEMLASHDGEAFVWLPLLQAKVWSG